MTLVAEKDTERASRSQTVKALLALREWLLAGALEPGERISELSIVDRIGVSRTPVRQALFRLEQEGFLESIPSGGFAVKAFSERDVFDAIEIRGVLEGLAARLAAERGAPSAALAELDGHLAAIDRLIAPLQIAAEAFEDYVHLNAAFHAGLSELAGSRQLARQIERAAALPFASPSGFVMAQSAMPDAGRVMIVAQDQHRCILDAITARQGERAESMAREHARLAARNLQAALKSQSSMRLVPGAALIKRR